MSERLALRSSRWARRGAARPALLALVLALPFTAQGCISDVDVPDCVRLDLPCGGGASGSAAANGGTSAASGSEAGGSSPTGGDDSAGGSLAGTGNGGTSAGEATAGGGAEGGGEAGASSCPSCVISPSELPAPCAGRPYQRTLRIDGGEAPYQWQLKPALDGWSIAVDPTNPALAVLKGAEAPSGNTQLTLQATDAAGKETSRKISLRAREACWFAYTALEASGPELHLVDPLAEPIVSEALQNNDGVFDFRFSPDGKHLAYSFGADAQHPHGRHLALVELATLHEQVLSFNEESVTSFAWSSDSSLVAAAFKTATGSYVGAVRLPSAGSNDAPVALSPTKAFVESELSWIDDRYLAYHAALLPDLANPGQFLPNPLGRRTAFVAELGPTGFAPEQMARATGAFEPHVALQPAPGGFYMITAGSPLTWFLSLEGSAPKAVAHVLSSLVSPSGKFSAQLDDGYLEVLSAKGGYDQGAVAATAGDDSCPMLLAWAEGAERIACVADVPNEGGSSTHGEVRFFDVQPDSDALSMSTLGGFCTDDTSELSVAACAVLQNGYAYGTEQAVGTARAFSASGRWFAFVTRAGANSYLYWADLERTPLEIKPPRLLTADGAPHSPLRLSFSPDERLLLLQYGGKQTIQQLASGPFGYFGETLTLGGDCTEEFPMAPSAYCGNTERVAPLQWALDSKALAYRTPGALSVVDLTRFFPGSEEFHLLAPECGTSCSGKFGFQPPLEQ